MAEAPHPAIDDSYWFAFSKNVVDTSVSRRDEAAATLQKVALWLWGVYTASATVGFALSEKDLTIGYATLIAAASVLLILLYWAAAWVQLPPLLRFDPRSPDDIRAAHNRMTLIRSRKLALAAALSLLAAASVSVALIAASVVPPHGEATLATPILSSEDGESRVVFSAFVPDAALVDILVEGRGKEPGRRGGQFRQTLIPLQGSVHGVVPIGEDVTGATVRVVWTDSSGMEHQLARGARTASGPASVSAAPR